MKTAVEFLLPLFWFELDTCCPGAKVAFLCAEIGAFRVCLSCKRLFPVAKDANPEDKA